MDHIRFSISSNRFLENIGGSLDDATNFHDPPTDNLNLPTCRNRCRCCVRIPVLVSRELELEVMGSMFNPPVGSSIVQNLSFCHMTSGYIWGAELCKEEIYV